MQYKYIKHLRHATVFSEFNAWVKKIGIRDVKVCVTVVSGALNQAALARRALLVVLNT